MWRLIIPAAALLVAGCASKVVIDPSWAVVPDAARFEAIYPPFAVEADLPGQVTLECVARVDGRLDLCRATKVIPQGLGFDRASLSVTPEYQVNPQAVDGQDQKARVVFTHRYGMADDVAPPRWTRPAPSAEQLEAAATLMRPIGSTPPGLEEMPLGVDVDREARVRAILAEVVREFEPRMREARVLALARLLTPEQAAYVLTREGPRPPPLNLDEFAETGDEVWQVGQEQSARLRSLYCAEFDCRPPPFLTEAVSAP